MLKFMAKKKIDHILDAAKRIYTVNGGKGTLVTFGAWDVDPRLLGFVYQVATDAERDKLKERAVLLQSLAGLPAQHGWPADACADVVFEIESQETIDRDNEGNWSIRFG